MHRNSSPLGASLRVVADRVRADLRLAFRTLRRTPAFTVAAIAILGIGIGMSTAMFSVFRAVLVERLPVTDERRLVVMHPLDRGGAHLDILYPYLEEIRRDTSVIRSVAGIYHLGALPNPMLDGDALVTLNTAYASPNLFEVLGTKPYLGRFFQPSDGEVGSSLAVVLSYATWRRLFHADSGIVGHVLRRPSDASAEKIIGVAPPGFDYPAGADGWTQLQSDFTAQVDVVARLAPGATLSTARAALFALTQRANPFAADKRPDLPQIAGVEDHLFSDEVLGGASRVIFVLTIAVGLLLLIVCVNVGNLVLVRTASRTREIAVRRAIGATYGDIARQFAIETIVVGAAGGVAGLISAGLLLRAFVVFSPVRLPRADVISLSGSPVGVAIATTVIAVILFGLGPSLIAARGAAYGSLRADNRSAGGTPSHRRVHRVLVAAQMALALVMLAGAGLLARSLNRLLQQDLGYEPDHVSLLQFIGPRELFTNDESSQRVADDLVKRFHAVPGVVAASVVESEPFKGTSFYIMKIGPAEESADDRARDTFVPFDAAGPDYFRTFRIPIIRGRGFLETDTRQSQQVVVLSEMLAKRLWPNADPIGKQIRNAFDSTNTPWTVVGIARDTHFRSFRESAPVVYKPFDQFSPPWWTGFIAVRTSGTLSSTLPALRAATGEVRSGLIIWNARTMDGFLDGSLAQPRLSALLLTGFSVVALLLASIGLYAVMSALVGQRTRDIGVRIALGATVRDVRSLILAEAMRVVAVGGLVGLVGALTAARFLESLLFDVRPADPISLLGAALVLAAIGAVAAFIPAQRAARIDPIQALRAD